ncbi:cyanophycinase [Nocardiopsis lambiniae]|uniref:Cyanophycinase n=1 Tax=Nocardiopsis lambiniae TaxID=3075539 RepID=A0ABU2MAX3_9ACTN|nr:cyanophycinase [Nocardiopsis sp. DSM 44743]MDT0329821.1 cyanophycinase [Nocardiopsis sp. DSM 44743]
MSTTHPPTPPRRAVVIAAAALATALLGPAAPATAEPGSAGPRPTEPTAGPVILIGGSLSDERVYEEIVRLAGGEDARIGVITASSVPESQDPDAGTPDCNNSRCNGDYYADLLEGHGAGDAEWIPVDLDHVENAESAEIAARVGDMTGFFFGGGDQYRYVTTLLRGDRHEDSAVLSAIRARAAQGAVVAGTSAGAAIQQAGPMVTGGDSHPGIVDGSRPGYFEDPSVLGHLPRGGFGFFTHGLVDTHFAERGRQGRMARLALDTGQERVFGVDEDTALVASPDGRFRVVGSGAVHVLDLRGASVGSHQGVWTADDVRWTSLTHGDAYRADTWTAVPADDKSAPASEPGRIRVGRDVFSSPDARSGEPGQMLRLARELSVSDLTAAYGLSHERRPRLRVDLSLDSRSAAYVGGDGAVSFTGIRVDIGPA